MFKMFITVLSRFFLIIFIITICCSLSTVMTAQRCPDNWTENKDMCYSVYEGLEVNYHEAIKFCSSQSGYLIIISSDELQNLINSWLINSTNVTKAWTSGQKAIYNYLEQNKTGTLWFWGDGKLIDYSKWHIGHPSSTTFDNCMVLQNVYDTSFNGYKKYLWQNFYDWLSVSCTEKATVICEKKACPQDWAEFKGMCYKIYDGLKMSHSNAQNHCIKNNAMLISISSFAEKRFLTQIISKCTSSFIWTSGKYVYTPKKEPRQEYRKNKYGGMEAFTVPGEMAKATGPWIWEELNMKFGYTNWIKGQGTGGINVCMNLQNRLSMNNDTLLDEYMWAQHSCDEKNAFICRKRP